MAGYSGTPLVQKLGLKAGMRAAILNPPWDYRATLGLAEAPMQVAQDQPLPPDCDYVHLFTPFRDELARRLAEARASMAPGGMIWVSWPKKAAKLYSEITEDTIRELCLPLGLVDIK